MDDGVIRQTEYDEKILTSDVPDEVLERASTALATGTAAVCRRF
jgi:hypothetical protein